jgi:hypothetical protein
MMMTSQRVKYLRNGFNMRMGARIAAAAVGLSAIGIMVAPAKEKGAGFLFGGTCLLVAAGLKLAQHRAKMKYIHEVRGTNKFEEIKRKVDQFPEFRLIGGRHHFENKAVGSI